MSKKKTNSTRELFLAKAKAKKGKTPIGQKPLSAKATNALRSGLSKLSNAAENSRIKRLELSGDGDDSIERELVELHHETGLDVLTLEDLPATNVDALRDAALRRRAAKRKSNWVKNTTKGWANRFDLSEQTIRTWNREKKPCIKFVRRGEYEINLSDPFIVNEGWKQSRGEQ